MAPQVTIEIYDEFPTDSRRKLTAKARSELNALFERLQANPYEPKLQRECLLHEDNVFEFALDGGQSIYWKVTDANASVTDLSGITVWLLKIAASSKIKKG